MNDNEVLKRITVNPKILLGKPIVRGRRIAAEHILGMLAAGNTPAEILEAYPFLRPRIFRRGSFLRAVLWGVSASSRRSWTKLREAGAGHLRPEGRGG